MHIEIVGTETLGALVSTFLRKTKERCFKWGTGSNWVKSYDRRRKDRGREVEKSFLYSKRSISVSRKKARDLGCFDE